MIALEETLAAAFARVALANVTREFPRKIDHLALEPPGDLAPRAQHPAFYGSFDWHSAVHMHWLLARLLRLFPQLPHGDQIRAVFDRHLSPESLGAELQYLQSPSGKTFERPYGWAWLLELQAELTRLAMPRWQRAVAPLASLVAQRFGQFLAGAPYPIRAGAHGNTAFACVLAFDYAGVAANHPLKDEIAQAARRWYGADRDAPIAYEPSLDDFLSPSLVEALLMKQVLPQRDFETWLSEFLPGGIESLARPACPADRSDPKQSHLDGLALSRAWCLRRLGGRFLDAAECHLAVGLPRAVGGDYVGEHWLASFAALALGDSP